LSITTCTAYAEGPSELFGIKLGAVYEFDITVNSNSNAMTVETTAPVDKVVGVRNNHYAGFTFHFKPLKPEINFPYLEYKSAPTINYVKSSFSFTTLFSVEHGIPQDPFNKKIMMEVISIQWSDQTPSESQLSEQEMYDQTVTNCNYFEAQYGYPNETFNSVLTYICKFWGENEAELRARTATPMGVDLAISSAISAKKYDRVYAVLKASAEDK